MRRRKKESPGPLARAARAKVLVLPTRTPA